MRDPWRLQYGTTAVDLGTVNSGYVFPTAPELDTVQVENEDTPRPRGDGLAFGSDFRRGRTVSLAIDVVGRDSDEARARLARLTTAWRADAVRSTPGAVAELVSDTGRSAFGRPRRFAPDLEGLPHGSVAVIADFATADDLWYGPEQRAHVSLVPPPSGGLLAPLAGPLTTTPTSDRSTAITVDGELPTWPVFEIAGPITNPVVEVVGVLRMEFRLSLAFDQTLVVDTRPWARSIVVDGAGVAGALTRTSTRLSRGAIPPGTHETVLRGSSDGLATLATRWQPAFHTP